MSAPRQNRKSLLAVIILSLTLVVTGERVLALDRVELVKNATFINDLNQWSVSGAEWTNTDTISPGCVRLTDNVNGRISQTIPVEGGKTYTFFFYYNLDSAGWIAASPTITWSTGESYAYDLRNEGGWAKVVGLPSANGGTEEDITAPAGATNLTVTLKCGYNSPAANIMFDNVSLTKVVPANVALNDMDFQYAYKLLNVPDVTGEMDGITSVMGIKNVKGFGAKGDGVTDDTLAIQNAVSMTTGTLYFPPGAYLISNTINLNPACYIEGAEGMTTLKMTAAFPMLSNAGHPVTPYVMKNITLAGNGMATTGIYLEQAFVLTLENIFIYDVQGIGIDLHRCEKAILRNIKVQNCQTGIDVKNGNQTLCQGLFLSGNGIGIRLKDAAGYKLDASAVNGDGNGIGIYIAGFSRGLTLSGNYSEMCETCIYAEPASDVAGADISGNFLVSAGNGSGGCIIIGSWRWQYSRIEGNFLSPQGPTANPAHSIYLSPGTAYSRLSYNYIWKPVTDEGDWSNTLLFNGWYPGRETRTGELIFVNPYDGSFSTLDSAGIHYQIRVKNGASTLQAVEGGVILVDASAGATYMYLPKADGNSGLTFMIKKIDATTNPIKLRGSGGVERIDGSLGFDSMDAQNDGITVVCDGSQWWIVSTCVKL